MAMMLPCRFVSFLLCSDYVATLAHKRGPIAAIQPHLGSESPSIQVHWCWSVSTFRYDHRKHERLHSQLVQPSSRFSNPLLIDLLVMQFTPTVANILVLLGAATSVLAFPIQSYNDESSTLPLLSGESRNPLFPNSLSDAPTIQTRDLDLYDLVARAERTGSG